MSTGANRPPLSGENGELLPRTIPTRRQPHPDRYRTWREYPHINIFATDLPMNVTTLEIYNNFKGYGEISQITILETQSSGRGSRAEIQFEPPPSQSFWPRLIPLVFHGQRYMVYVRIAHNQVKHAKIVSPLRDGIQYNRQTELPIECIGFGVLLEPLRMLNIKSRHGEQNNAKLTLNLWKRCIDIVFPSWIESNNSSAARLFRFRVPLDEAFKIWCLADGKYVLHLENVPRYSKQLKEAMDETHTHDAKKWTIEDTWARQTDIVGHKDDVQRIGKSTICLRKPFNTLNIARWTTFQLNLDTAQDISDRENVFCDALKDFNVKILDGRKFVVTTGSPQMEEDAWRLVEHYLSEPNDIAAQNDHSTRSLSFGLRFQLAVCISHNWLSEFALSEEFFQALAGMDPARAEQMLLHLSSVRQREWQPMKLFSDLKYSRPVRSRQLPQNHMEIRSATVTATTILFHAPAVELTNRIIRKYKSHAHRFLRVRFEDDVCRGQTKLRASTNNQMIQVFRRVRSALRHGIDLGNVHYEFLAWGNSQLREHAAYFFARTGDISAASIRAEMGVFDNEKVVAKRAARMGQCFSTTRPVELALPSCAEMVTIGDIERGARNFTDGVGMISSAAAQKIQVELKIPGKVPSVFQFRLGGCKGVLAVWPQLPGIEVQVRASQFKFSSTTNELEIIRWSEFWQPFLNRQLILCLSELGVKDEVFLHMQEKIINALDDAMVDEKAALKALRDTVDPNRSTLSMCQMIEAGFHASGEPFVSSLLLLWRAWTLKYLKQKAKIPVRHGAFVLGCADETGMLRGYESHSRVTKDTPKTQRTAMLPEIFIQITNPQTGKCEIITGVCVLARNPSLHRGDIRVVQAVDVEGLRHLCDVVVMPILGDRDLPSMCSGGDLDGDDYVVIWDKDLIPEVWDAEPFHYNPPSPKTAVNEITTDDIVDFFYDYLQHDTLGLIAHAHLATADFAEEGIEHPDCLELVQLHSVAVDYPKTGVPAVMLPRLDRTKWPHFMEKKNSYKSHKILGKLYDAVKRVTFKPVYVGGNENPILRAYEPNDRLRTAVKFMKHDYDNALQRIMAQHEIATEFEVFSTFVLSHSKASNDFKFHEEIGNLSSSLKEQYRQSLVELAEGTTHEQLAPVAIAAYCYTQDQIQKALQEIDEDVRMEGPEGMPFISFPWILQDTLCWIANPLTAAPGIEEEHPEPNDQRQRGLGVYPHNMIGRRDRLLDEFDMESLLGDLFPGCMADPFVSRRLISSDKHHQIDKWLAEQGRYSLDEDTASKDPDKQGQVDGEDEYTTRGGVGNQGDTTDGLRNAKDGIDQCENNVSIASASKKTTPLVVSLADPPDLSTEHMKDTGL